MALLSGLGFILTSRYMLTCLSTLPKLDSLNDHRHPQDHESLLRKPTQSVHEKSISTEPRSSMPKALKYLIQLCKGKNFAIFIAVSLLQGIGSYWPLMITTKLDRSNSTNNYDLPTRSQLLHIKILGATRFSKTIYDAGRTASSHRSSLFLFLMLPISVHFCDFRVT